MAEYYVNFDDIKHLDNLERTVFFAVLNQVRYSQQGGEFVPLPIWVDNTLSNLDLDYDDEYSEEEVFETLDTLKDYGLLNYSGFFTEKERERSIEISINPYSFIRKNRKDVLKRNNRIKKNT